MRQIIIGIVFTFFCMPASLWAQILTSGTVSIYDEGSISNSQDLYSVDVIQDECGDEADPEPEPFFNTLIGIELKNEFFRGITLHRFRYRIGGMGAAGRFASRALAPSSSGRLDPKEEKEVILLSFLAKSGRKFFHETSEAIPEDLGFRNLRITLVGRDGTNRRYTKNVRFGLSFGNYDRCS